MACLAQRNGREISSLWKWMRILSSTMKFFIWMREYFGGISHPLFGKWVKKVTSHLSKWKRKIAFYSQIRERDEGIPGSCGWAEKPSPLKSNENENFFFVKPPSKQMKRNGRGNSSSIFLFQTWGAEKGGN